MALKGKGKGKGKGEGKRKKKKAEFDVSDAACGLFGMRCGNVVRTPFGQDVTIVGVKYANAELKIGPTLWAEHPNGHRAPLAISSDMAPEKQLYQVQSAYHHLCRDIDRLDMRPTPATPRPKTASSFLAIGLSPRPNSRAASEEPRTTEERMSKLMKPVVEGQTKLEYIEPQAAPADPVGRI